LERIRAIVSNSGFLLQITGLFLILPIAIGFLNAEFQPVESLTATCFLCFALGFVFNSFCERKELDEKTSLWLMLITWIILPAVLMIPYAWNNVFGTGNLFDLLTNAYFETVSGFSTTGFTFIANAESSLPVSLFFYRSLVEFIGGIGFIYLIVAFLYPSHRLDSFAEAYGFDRLGRNLKRVFLSVMLVYTFFVFVFTAVFYLVYSPDLVVASCAAIDILTGGYAPSVTGGIGIFQVSIVVLMLLGSLNFSFHYNLFHFKPLSALTREVKLYVVIIVVTTVMVSILAWLNPFDSLFHVLSMMSSTGVDYIGVATQPVGAKILFIIVGLIGGCAFSMAGGVRIQRIRLLIDGLRKKGDKPDREELKAVVYYIVGFLVLLLVLSLVFSTIGISFIDSVFEVGSALTTNGISMGITTLEIPLGYKWLLILAMIFGRIEIIVLFRVVSWTNIFGKAKGSAKGLKARALKE